MLPSAAWSGQKRAGEQLTMRMTLFAAGKALVLVLLGLAAPAAAQEATVLGRFEATNSGQAILLPQGPAAVTVSRVVIAAGSSLPVHKHPHARYAYVESGQLRVSNLDTGGTKEFGPGDTIIEARGQWHTGTALGAAPVVLLVIDQTPPGETNTIRREP
jgi:quercetin dioxygenase-like cupin family protein